MKGSYHVPLADHMWNDINLVLYIWYSGAMLSLTHNAPGP